MRTLLGLTLLFSVTGQLMEPTAPPIFPPETGPPHDMRNCRINSNTIFPWILAVYDNSVNRVIGLGSMLTYITFVSTCRQYHKRPSGYTARGQFIWNITRILSPCSQDRRILAIRKHPKCLESRQLATFFDFTVFKLNQPFAITGPVFPTMGLDYDAIDMMGAIKYINTERNTIGCIIPSFLSPNDEIPVFDWDTYVEAVPFHTECVKMLCEKTPPDAGFTAMCTDRFLERAKGTQLCFTYKNTTKRSTGSDNVYWSAGAPLVCNSSVYGIAAQTKHRDPTDIHYVVTLLRVWRWLLGIVKENGVPWTRTGTVKDGLQLRSGLVSPEGLDAGDEDLPSGLRSNSVGASASIKNTISALLLYCFLFQI